MTHLITVGWKKHAIKKTKVQTQAAHEVNPFPQDSYLLNACIGHHGLYVACVGQPYGICLVDIDADSCVTAYDFGMDDGPASIVYCESLHRVAAGTHRGTTNVG